MYKYPTKSRSNIVLSQPKIGKSLSIQLNEFKNMILNQFILSHSLFCLHEM